MAKSKVDIGKYTPFLWIDSFPSWLPTGAGKGASGVVFGLSNYIGFTVQVRMCVIQEFIGFSVYLH